MASPNLDSSWPSSPCESYNDTLNIYIEEANPADISPALEVPTSSFCQNHEVPKPPRLLGKSVKKANYYNRLTECNFVPKETKNKWDRLFKEGYGSDVCILTEDESMVPAHSSVLSMASPVLGNLLQQSKVKNGMRYIKIPRGSF